MMLQAQKNPNFNKLDTAFLAGWKAAKEYFTSFMTEVEAPQIDGGEFSLLRFNDFLASLEKTHTKEDLETEGQVLMIKEVRNYLTTNNINWAIINNTEDIIRGNFNRIRKTRNERNA